MLNKLHFLMCEVFKSEYEWGLGVQMVVGVTI